MDSPANSIDQVDEALHLVGEIEAIILLDLAGVTGGWKDRVDDIYGKLQQIRALLSDSDPI